MIKSKVTYRMYFILLFLAAVYICILQDRIPMIFMFYIIDDYYDTKVYTDILFYLLFSSLVFFLYFQAHFPPKNGESNSKKSFIKKELYLFTHVLVLVAVVYVVFTVLINRFYVSVSVHYITIDFIEKYRFMQYVIAVINDLEYSIVLILSYHIIGRGTIVIVNSAERIQFTWIINKISGPLAFFYLKILALRVFTNQIIAAFFTFVWEAREKNYSLMLNSFGDFFFRHISSIIDAVCIVLIFQALLRYSNKDNGYEVKNCEQETTKLPGDLH